MIEMVEKSDKFLSEMQQLAIPGKLFDKINELASEDVSVANALGKIDAVKLAVIDLSLPKLCKKHMEAVNLIAGLEIPKKYKYGLMMLEADNFNVAHERLKHSIEKVEIGKPDNDFGLSVDQMNTIDEVNAEFQYIDALNGKLADYMYGTDTNYDPKIELQLNVLLALQNVLGMRREELLSH